MASPKAAPLVLLSATGTVVDDAGQPVVGALIEVAAVVTHPDPGTAATSVLPAFDVAPLAGQTLGVTDSVPPLPGGAAPDSGSLLPAARARSGARGTFRIDGIPAGTVQLVASAPGFASASSRAIQLVAGVPTANVELVLRRGGGLRGRVVDERGFPIERALVRARTRGAPKGTGAPALSDARGEFELRDLVPGKYALSVEREGYTSARRELLVDADAPTELEPFALVATGSLSGDVVDRLGAPVRGAEVAVGSPPAWKRAARSDSQGRFRLTGVAPGEHRVSARRKAGASPTATSVARVIALEETPGVILRLAD